jgi:hypothetical protein
MTPTEYEHVVYNTAGFELEAGFYTADDLRQMLKAIEDMNAIMEFDESKEAKFKEKNA